MGTGWRAAYQWLARRGGKRRLLLFIFHRVLPEKDALRPFEPDVREFEWIVRFIATSFSVLRLEEAISRLGTGDLPAGAACITFDDGYRDNVEVALPVLQRHGVIGTFFIATGYLGDGRMWNDDVIEAVRLLAGQRAEWEEFGLGSHSLASTLDCLRCLDAVLPKLKYYEHGRRTEVARAIARRSGLPEPSTLMMNPEHVRMLAAEGMEIGAHTHTHPILRQLPVAEVRAEIARGKDELERLAGDRIRVIAYPNGNTQRDLAPRDVQVVKDLGFVGAVTTRWGVADNATDPFLLPRFTPWDRTPLRFAWRCAMVLAGKLSTETG